VLNRSHGCPRSRRPLILGLLFLLAAGLVWSLPGGVMARSMFQSSSPPTFPDTPTPTPTATLEEQPTFTAPATPAPIEPSTVITSPATPVVVPVTEVPTAVAPTDQGAVTAVAGFLPAPTLTAPGAFPPSAMLPLQGADNDDTAASEPTPTPIRAPTLLDQLISLNVLVGDYLWLGCGGILVLIAAGVAAWWWQRGRASRQG
jgi:hypothetical protein